MTYLPYKLLSRVLLAALFLTGIDLNGVLAQPAVIHNPVKVIFETDMGNDIDDALALSMLYRYTRQGKVEIIAISNNKQSINSVRFLDLMNKWYNYPKIPIGTVRNGKSGEDESGSFAKKVIDYSIKGKEVFNSRIDDYSKVEESVTLYRRILSDEPDHSVMIISVGFFTNLARLLESGPDRFSKLNGAELVARKVKYLSVMAGNFSRPPTTEFNVRTDIAAARKVYEQWPGIIYSSPFEVGNSILFPASCIEKNLGYAGNHPLVEGYKQYLPMPYNRQTWDLTAVLFAVEQKQGYFNVSKPGSLSVTNEGYTSFSEDTNGKHFYLMNPDSAGRSRILSRFIELVNAIPKSAAEERK